jgi:hypothetical protein
MLRNRIYVNHFLLNNIYWNGMLHYYMHSHITFCKRFIVYDFLKLATRPEIMLATFCFLCTKNSMVVFWKERVL